MEMDKLFVVTNKIDSWSFACLLYEIIVGETVPLDPPSIGQLAREGGNEWIKMKEDLVANFSAALDILNFLWPHDANKSIITLLTTQFSKLLSRNPNNRPDLSDFVNHFELKSRATVSISDFETFVSVMENRGFKEDDEEMELEYAEFMEEEVDSEVSNSSSEEDDEEESDMESEIESEFEQEDQETESENDSEEEENFGSSSGGEEDESDWDEESENDDFEEQ